MITTEEYLREKAHKEVAEARIIELEAELAQLRGENEVQPEPEGEDALKAHPYLEEEA